MRSIFHLLPYVLFVLIAVVGEQIGGVWPSALEPIRAAIVLVVIAVLYKRGAYPDLAQRETPCRHATWLAIGAGIAVGLLWVPLGLAVPTIGGGRGNFDADALGPQWTWLLLGGRLVASVIAIPVAEELVVRSLVPRWIEAAKGDWRDVPIGKFTVLSFAASVGFFVITHPEWLAAAFTGALWILLIVRTRRLRDAVLAHAIANALLDTYVLLAGDYRWW
jgi:CAAX prenyl protease-like protein